MGNAGTSATTLPKTRPLPHGEKQRVGADGLHNTTNWHRGISNATLFQEHTMKAGALIGLGWAILGIIMRMILNEQLLIWPEIMEAILVWTVIGAIVGGAIEILIKVLNRN
jgi:hypothetical protein